MRFVATLCSKVTSCREAGTPSAAYRLIVEAPSWDAARSFARTRDAQPVVVLAISDDRGDPDFELRWEGDDFNAGGTPDARRLQWRPWGQEFDVAWRDLSAA